MHSNAALLLTFIASASAAIDYMAIPHVRRELDLLPRATSPSDSSSDDASKCASEALSIAQSIPTPPPALVSDLAQHPITDACHFSFPASLSAEYSSYSSEVFSWFKGHEGELTSLASECSVLQSYTGLVNSCTDGGSSPSSGPNTAAAAPSSSSGSGSGSGSGSDSASKTGGSASKTGGSASKTGGSAATSTNAGAARETGMAFAALAAAGLAAIL